MDGGGAQAGTKALGTEVAANIGEDGRIEGVAVAGLLSDGRDVWDIRGCCGRRLCHDETILFYFGAGGNTFRAHSFLLVEPLTKDSDPATLREIQRQKIMEM